MTVKAKKHLGQHFLTDKNICQKIANQFTHFQGCHRVLEIGPGMGVLTDYLLKGPLELYLIDIDKESIAYLHKKYPELGDKIIQGDFLRLDLRKTFEEKYAIIGNFPYNISSQILFKVLEEKDKVTEVVCMLQKEVAKRIASPKGNKDYGILSVLLLFHHLL
jgi:16S rRNA (adenine1518-N6/adenine1519-N6)-dimethyltransferase